MSEPERPDCPQPEDDATGGPGSVPHVSGEVEPGRETRDLESRLVDLTHVPLAQLRISDDSVLAHALRRLVEDAKDPTGVVAGFNSAL